MSENNKFHKWTEEHRKKYNETLNKLAAENNGAKCSKEASEKFRRNMLGNTRGFKKGQPPWSKGKKCPQLKTKGMFGKHLSDHAKELLRIANLGKHLTEEHKRKLSENSKGRVWYNNGIEEKLFKVMPDETWMKGRLHKIE